MASDTADVDIKDGTGPRTQEAEIEAKGPPRSWGPVDPLKIEPRRPLEFWNIVFHEKQIKTKVVQFLRQSKNS